METTALKTNNNNYTPQGWGAAILMGLIDTIRFEYTNEVSDIECLPDHRTVSAGMIISERSLHSVWKDEDDAGWEQYL